MYIHIFTHRPGFHRVMTSLSKIYSRAKAANKGKTGTTNVTTSPFATKTALSPPSQLTSNKDDSKIGSSIFQPVPSESGTAARTVGGGISSALASLTGGKTNLNNVIKHGGVTNIYFNNRNSSTNTDQYLIAKPKIPSRVSSDPIKVYKQTDNEIEEQRKKAWSSDVLSKALKSWPTANDKTVISATSNIPENEKSVRLYDFSSTPTGITSSSITERSGERGSDCGSKSPSSRHSRHSSIGPESPNPGSFSLEKNVGDKGGGNKHFDATSGLLLSDSGGRRVFSLGSSSTGSGGSHRSSVGKMT